MSYYSKKYEPVTVKSGSAGATQQKSTSAAQNTAPAQQRTNVPKPAPVDRTQYEYDASTNDAYEQALAALRAAQSNKPTYAGTYDAQLNEVYQQITNRKPFRYDVNEDVLYQQYADQYQRLGELAMRDTMGQAAGLTGGYGNTFAQSAGQQQYDAYLQKLNEVVPELYGMAQDQYNREGEALHNQFAMVGDLADREYGRYQDELNNYWQNIGYLQDEADTAYNRGYENWYNAQQMGMQQDQFNYQKEQDAADRKYQEMLDAWNQSFQESQFAYQKEQDALESEWRDKEYQREQEQIAYEKQLQAYNKLSELISATGYVPSPEELQAAGMSEAQANAYRDYFTAQSAKASGGSGGNPGGGDEAAPEEDEEYTPTAPVENDFSGVTKSQAEVYLKSNNAPTADIIDRYTWERQKAYSRQPGSNAGYEITNYDSYDQYLKAVVGRNMYYKK